MTPMQMPQQSPVPPALQALMALTEGLQRGQVAPTTPDGQPTIASQAVQAAAPQAAPQPGLPGMQQAMQGAKVGAQQSMQDQQEGMQLLQNMVKQQRAPQGGILGAPGAQGGPRMAEGGIVGYAGGGLSVEELEAQLGDQERRRQEAGAMQRRLREQEIRNEMAAGREGAPISVEELRALTGINSEIPIPEIPGAAPSAPMAASPVSGGRGLAAGPTAAQLATLAPKPVAPRGMPPAGGAPQRRAGPVGAAPNPMAGGIAANVPGTSSEAIYKRSLDEAGKLPTAPPSAQAALGRAGENDAAMRAWLISQGINPDLIKQQMKENDALTDRRTAMLRGEREHLQGTRAWDGIISALSGARGYKGMGGTSTALRTAGEAGARTSEVNRVSQVRLVDLEIKVQELAAQQRQALQNSEKAAAEGKMDIARNELLKAQELSAARTRVLAEIHAKRGSDVAQQETGREKNASDERQSRERNATMIEVARINDAQGGGGRDPADIRSLRILQGDPKLKAFADSQRREEGIEKIRMRAVMEWGDLGPLDRRKFDNDLSKFISATLQSVYGSAASTGAGGAAAPTPAKQRLQYNPATGKLE